MADYPSNNSRDNHERGRGRPQRDDRAPRRDDRGPRGEGPSQESRGYRGDSRRDSRSDGGYAGRPSQDRGGYRGRSEDEGRGYQGRGWNRQSDDSRSEGGYSNRQSGDSRGYQRRDGEERGYSRRPVEGRGYGRDDDRPRADRGDRGDRMDRGDRGERGYQRRDGDERGYSRRPVEGRGYGRDDVRPRTDGPRTGSDGPRTDRTDRGDRSERGYRGNDDRRGPRREDSRDDQRGYRGRDERRDGGGDRYERGPQNRSDRRGGDRPVRRDFREDRPRRDEDDFVRPGLAAREDEPETPEDIDEKSLPFPVRAELRGLPKDLGHIVAAHLVAAGELIDEDPALAYRHAEAARRRAARLPVVREATAETAYAAGEFAVALNEYRALRRMTGGADYLPVMADCERALGRADAALKLAKEAANQPLDATQRVEMLLVESGARDDLGQRAEALRLLKNAIGDKTVSKQGQSRLRYAYADLLERSGQSDAAKQWFTSAGKYDAEGLLDVEDRLNQLDGFVLEIGEDDDESIEASEANDDQDGSEDGEAEPDVTVQDEAGQDEAGQDEVGQA
ncbi:hypothetical protein AAEX63_15470 [Luteococcus sp. H138]|uniref:hypothetical protein n=1 Tax=unclassified Luteococcus TaxID=2639923 RepID=UPI00313B3EF8